MVRHESSEKKRSASLLEDEASPSRVSPYEGEKKALRKQIEDLDKFHRSLPQAEQIARETVWIEGRNQYVVRLAAIRNQEKLEGVFDEHEDDLPDPVPNGEKPVKSQSPVEPKDPESPNPPEPANARRNGG